MRADDTGSLYGCTCGQVLYYLAHYYIPGDHTHVKALVRDVPSRSMPGCYDPGGPDVKAKALQRFGSGGRKPAAGSRLSSAEARADPSRGRCYGRASQSFTPAIVRNSSSA